ncbi:MAG TPA: crossover junction endodeoxyribonuclease RuvC [Gemmatimonadales bacterium]|nr:crossover junction endodeoxyribonuclease RuvC [Gemmatimonadales bacterium]
MRVLGVDPGTAVVGYGVVDAPETPAAAAAAVLRPTGLKLVECGILQTKARDPLPARLRIIHDGISALIARHRPDAVAVESAFYGKNVRTTMVLSHARGVILLAAEEAGTAIAEYPPALVKKTIVGRGAALKSQVGYMVAQMLRLKAPPTPEDASDGVALALTHLLIASRRAAFFRQVTGA